MTEVNIKQGAVGPTENLISSLGYLVLVTDTRREMIDTLATLRSMMRTGEIINYASPCNPLPLQINLQNFVRGTLE